MIIVAAISVIVIVSNLMSYSIGYKNGTRDTAAMMEVRIEQSVMKRIELQVHSFSHFWLPSGDKVQVVSYSKKGGK